MSDLSRMSDDELLALYRKQQTPGFLNSPIGGFIRGARDIVDGGAQLLTRGLEAIAPEGSAFESFMREQRQGVEGINREAERDYQQNWRRGEMEGVDWGRMAGNIAATGPVASAGGLIKAASLPARMAQSGAVGAASAAMQPVNDGPFWAEKADQLAFGGMGGAAAAPIAGAIARVVQPRTTDAAKRLMAEGVQLTPGQVSGRGISGFEQKMTSVPLVGDMVRSRQVDAVKSFNKAVANRALANIGEKVPDNVPAGREMVDYVRKTLGNAYDDLLPGMVVKADAQLADDVASAVDDFARVYPQHKDQLIRYLQEVNRFPGNEMPGDLLKPTQTQIREWARSLAGSQGVADRDMGKALSKVDKALREAVRRSAPAGKEGALDAIDRGWAQSETIKNAAGRVGSADGVFSAEAFRSAVRAGDPSRGKSAFATGNAPMSQLADDAVDVLGKHVPDSGTPGRAMAALLALTGGGFAVDPLLGTAVGAGSLMYTDAGRRALVAALAKRPEGAQALAQTIRQSVPAKAALLPAALLGNSLPAGN